MIDIIKVYKERMKSLDENSNEYKIRMKTIIEKFEEDLKYNNPDKILDKYVEYLKEMKFKTICIKKGTEFYRGRIGKKIVSGGVDDLNTYFSMPYYGEMIKTAPPLHTSGGRFNRAGTSYLYLATNLETCFAEVHLQVGQECSIGKFKCIEDIELIDLNDSSNDIELKILYSIVTQPVHDEIAYKYLTTQFIADVLMKLNSNGLYFKSVQSNGDNIVCFKPDKFELVKYSEKLYRAKKIDYEYEMIEDTIREYAKRDDEHLINNLNTEVDEENEKQVEYLREWIENEKNLK